MSQTTAIPAGTASPSEQHRGRVLPAIAVLSLIAITTDDIGSVAPPQPVVQQQEVPADQVLSRGSLDACGRPIVRDHLSCR